MKTAKEYAQIDPQNDYEARIKQTARALTGAGMGAAVYQTQYVSGSCLWRMGEDTRIIPPAHAERKVKAWAREIHETHADPAWHAAQFPGHFQI